MQRAQRKANLKKLREQNENTNRNTLQSGRRKLRSDKSREGTIHSDCLDQGRETTVGLETQCANLKVEEEMVEANPEDHTLKRRLNLTRFLYKNKKDIPTHILKTDADSDSFETPVKKVKRAPKLNPPVDKPKRNRSRKPTRQQKITTAFLRDEQMFSEVAAQHCIAENFNPDEVQLALALSRSEVETKISCENNISGIENEQPGKSTSPEENIRSKLQKFGFRTAARKDYENCFAAVFNTGQRRNKAKWANKFTSLTLRDPEVQSKKLIRNIEGILNQQFKTKEIYNRDQNLKPYVVQSKVLSPNAVVDQTLQIFRNMETMSTTENLERFFITELFPVTQLSAGHLLKDWKVIPGRDLSPDQRSKSFKGQMYKNPKFYEDLEKGFWNKIVEPRIDRTENENPVVESVVCGSRKSTDCPDFDGLLGVIGSGPKVLEFENAMHSPKKHESSPTQTCAETVELKLSSNTQPYGTSQVQTRPASPDLFADSDSDGAEVVEVNSLKEITTYEVYSSDDVKNSSKAGCKIDSLSVKADDIEMIVDLTQDDMDTMSVDDCKQNDEVPACKNHQISKRLDFLEIAMEGTSTNDEKASTNFLEEDEDDRMEAAICKALGVKPFDNSRKENSLNRFLSDSAFEMSKNHSFERPTNKCEMQKSSSIASVNLTQSDNDSTDDCGNNDTERDEGNDAYDDDCIVLSDDEVNYSIWKAAKVNAKTPSSKVKVLNESFYNDQQKVDDHNFSVLDLIDVEHSFKANETEMERWKSADDTFAKHSSFDLNCDIEPINKEYLSPQCQQTPRNDFSISDMLKRQRAEFGILESQSEPFSPSSPPWMRTPIKATPQKNMSPCNTPATSHEPLQRLSRYSSSRKFQSFLFDAPQTPNKNMLPIAPADEDDFDEFDRLVYGTPAKRSNPLASPPDVPKGLSQLLTAEISLDAQRILTPMTPKKSPSSELLKAITPEKVNKIGNKEEIKINDNVYVVRVTSSPKPDFAAQSDGELLKQLYNFGIKPLKRRHAIKLLEYIYNETHPIMAPSENDDGIAAIDYSSENGSPKGNDNLEDKEFSDEHKPQLKLPSNKFNLQDCHGDILLRYSTDLSAELRYDEEDFILQTNVTKKTQQPLLPLHIAWFNLVCSNKELHESILMYEPIDLQEIYLFLKSLGYRYDPKDLKCFFDRRCIIFRYDLTPPDKQANRHIRKPNKKTTNNTQKPTKSRTAANSQRTLDKYFSL